MKHIYDLLIVFCLVIACRGQWLIREETYYGQSCLPGNLAEVQIFKTGQSDCIVINQTTNIISGCDQNGNPTITYCRGFCSPINCFPPQTVAPTQCLYVPPIIIQNTTFMSFWSNSENCDGNYTTDFIQASYFIGGLCVQQTRREYYGQLCTADGDVNTVTCADEHCSKTCKLISQSPPSCDANDDQCIILP